MTTHNAVLVPGGGRNGDGAAKLVATPGAGVAETISGLKPGDRYLVTGWVETEDGFPIYVGAFDNDNTASAKGYSGTWEKLSVVYTVGPGQTAAEVLCIMKAGGTGLCTDMSFRAIEQS